MGRVETPLGNPLGSPQYFCCWPCTAQSSEGNYHHCKIVYETVTWTFLGRSFCISERALNLTRAFANCSSVSCYIKRKQWKTDEQALKELQTMLRARDGIRIFTSVRRTNGFGVQLRIVVPAATKA